MNDLHNLINIKTIPAYSVRNTAQYLRIPLKTLRAWTAGFDYDHSQGSLNFDPLINISNDNFCLLSFINIVEAHVLYAIQSVHKIQPPQLWSSIIFIKNKLDLVYPLVDQRFATKGIDLLVQHYGELIGANQGISDRLTLSLNNCFRRVEFDNTELPSKLYPFTRSDSFKSPKIISIDPLVTFGHPVIDGTGITTSILKERYYAGESIEDLAIDYHCYRSSVEEAIRVEL